MAKPIGISEATIEKEIALIQAFGEIQNTPAAKLAAIISKTKTALRGGP